MVVFSTNLEPSELADEAFLRRIPNKILVRGVDAETFDAIFRLTAAAAVGLECEEGAAPTAAKFACVRGTIFGPVIRATSAMPSLDRHLRGPKTAW